MKQIVFVTGKLRSSSPLRRSPVRQRRSGSCRRLSLFRRQVPFGKYVPDFVCHSARLIVELDGESHDFESRRKTDQKRDAWFESQGYIVLRFTNDQVLRELEGVVHLIRETASARRTEPPSPPLPHKGGGNSSEVHVSAQTSRPTGAPRTLERGQ